LDQQSLKLFPGLLGDLISAKKSGDLTEKGPARFR
jgi:hypothetical protein